MQRTKRTIEETVDAGLCTGCGTCVGLCPNSAIYMSKAKDLYKPKLNKKKCSQCGICFEVCPGHSVNFEQLNLMIFGEAHQDINMGSHINCYVGHANDLNIRYNSASGGLITTLLIFAIEKQIIDGALVTKMNEAHPLEPEVFIARTKDEIISASKSKYCPVPANIALKDILKEDGRFATVGIPCHIEAIRKAESINKELARKIVLHLGLFCKHAPTFLATTYLLQRMKVKEEDVKKMDYRGEGWPGRFSVMLKSGERKSAKLFNPYYQGYVFPTYFFTSRCLLCNDKSCELSDISFGDARGQTNTQIGESAIISRSKVGNELLWRAAEDNVIRLKKTNCEDTVKYHSMDLAKRRHKARRSVFIKLGKAVPAFNQKVLESKPMDYAEALMCYIRLLISSKPQLWNLIDIYPLLATHIKGLHENWATCIKGSYNN